MSMNLHHRFGEDKHMGTLDLIMSKMAYPLNFLIPLGLTLISLFVVRNYFGNEFELGSFSTNYWIQLAAMFGRWLNWKQEMIISTFVLLFYTLGPLTTYLFVYTLTERHLAAIITAILIQLPTFPFSTQPPTLLTLALVDRDAAHITALSIMPLSAMAFLRYLRNKEISQLIFFSVFAAVMASFSFFSIYILVIVMLFITISEVLIGQGRTKMKQALNCLGILVLTILAVYNLSLWGMVTSPEGQTTIKVFFNFIPLSFFLVPILGTFFFLIFDRRPKLQPIFLSLTLLILFWLFHWIRTSFVNVPLFDQDRYAAEVAFSRSFAIGVFMTIIFDLARGGVLLPKLKLAKKQRHWLSFAGMTIIIFSLIASLVFIPRNIE